MKRIALVATDISRNKAISSISITKCLNLSEVGEVFTFSDIPFYPQSINITTDSGSIFSRLRSLKLLLNQSNSNYFLFINWDSSLANHLHWTSKYLDGDFLSTPIWIEENAYLMGSDNFSISSRKFIEAQIEILNKKNKNFLEQQWDALTILRLQAEFLSHEITFSPHKSNQQFCYESGPIGDGFLGFSSSANFPFFWDQQSLLPHANDIINRQTNPITLLIYLKNCVERNMVDLFRVSVANFSEKPSLQNALRYELAQNPSSELPGVISFFNQT
jgi:hypothetical protein